MSVEPIDIAIIGAGPAGLQAACSAQDHGLSYVAIDRRGLAHSFTEYPETLRFFSPPDEMEVGGVPFPVRGGEKPCREDILPYFRAVAFHRRINLACWQSIVSVERRNGAFVIATRSEPSGGSDRTFHARGILVASGMWDVPNMLDCPGSALPHVSYRFHEPTEYYGQRVAVVGGGNSAITAALMLAEAHAVTTLIMRRKPEAFQSHLRPFVVRDLELALEDGRLTCMPNAAVSRIGERSLEVVPIEYAAADPSRSRITGPSYEVAADHVFALLGHRGDTSLFGMLGIGVQADGRPFCDPVTFESPVSNIWILGALAARKIDIIIRGRAQAAEVVARAAERLASTGGRTV